MADELLQYGLDELVVGWHRTDLPETLLRLSGDPGVRRKFAAMQAAYARTHTEAEYARRLRAAYAGDPA